MKKYSILLLFFIAAEYACAQQTERPLFRDFMNKKNDFAPGSENSIAVLPKNDLQSRMYLPKPETKRVRSRPGHDLSNLKRNFATPSENISLAAPETNNAMARFSHVLPNGNKVYILPQDNMPCVVPDMSAFNMPVAGGGLDTDKAIHATPPQKIIPSSQNTLLPQQQTSGKK